MPLLHCTRCGLERDSLDKAPLPAEDGVLVLTLVCAECWGEWREEEVRIINELRLNFIDPEAQKTLRDRMFGYLNLKSDDESVSPTDEPLCDRTESSV